MASRVPLLLVVTGLPCSGKTTVARRLADDLGLPLLTKDDIKERLFDTLGWSDRDWSRKLGGATYEILYYSVEAMLAGGASLIAESNFPPVTAGDRLAEIRGRHPFRLGIVECVARADLLKARWARRAQVKTRHPGHNDSQALAEFLNHIDVHTDADGVGRLGTPQLGADEPDPPRWVVDTSHRVSVKNIAAEIAKQFLLFEAPD
jgi:predicted kinase